MTSEPSPTTPLSYSSWVHVYGPQSSKEIEVGRKCSWENSIFKVIQSKENVSYIASYQALGVAGEHGI